MCKQKRKTTEEKVAILQDSIDAVMEHRKKGVKAFFDTLINDYMLPEKFFKM